MPHLLLALSLTVGGLNPDVGTATAAHFGPRTATKRCAVAATLSPCTWNSALAKCTPEACVAHHCGMLACDCRARQHTEMAPWEVLKLDPRKALSPYDVRTAFLDAVREMQPDQNVACRELAGATFLTARRARDQLLTLAATFGEPEVQAAVSAIMVDEDSFGLRQPTPFLKSLWQLGRRWAQNTMYRAHETVRRLGGWLQRVRTMAAESIGYFIHHPAVFVIFTLSLQFLVVSQLA